ncbi:MAG TPA: efflux transporter outer membrane subunit [Steroidobacteraceae bacterium]
MRAHLTVTAVGFTLALAACASSHGLHPHGVLMDPASLSMKREPAQVALSSVAWPSADWWSALGDAQLDALIAEALQNNPNLAQADARAQQAEANTAFADAVRKPEISASGRVAEVRLPTTLPPLGNGHNKAAKYLFANFSWHLDPWGGERAAWEAALGVQRATEIDAQAARILLSGNVARAYVQLGYAYAQQDVAAAELKRANDVRTLTQQRLAAGIDNVLQLKESDSEVASAQGQSARADRAIDAARSALSVLLGKGPDRGSSLTRPQLLAPKTLEIPADLPAELLGHRADLVAARWRVEASEKDIESAKTQFLPNINITALAGLLALGGGDLIEAKSRLYAATPAVSLPIFDAGRRRAHLSGKDAEYDVAVAQYNETLVRAVNQVADERDALDSLQLQIEAQQRALDAANDAWLLAEGRFKGGIGSYLEALSVRQVLLLAEERMAALRAQQADFSVQMIQALGGGYRPNRSAPNLSAVIPRSASPFPTHRT